VKLEFTTKNRPYLLGSFGQAQLPVLQDFFFRFTKKRMTVRATVLKAAGVCQSMALRVS
jgi:hypothetical protein